MNCPYCGAPLQAGSQFCTTCGARLESQGDAQQSYQAAAYQQPQGDAQQPYQNAGYQAQQPYQTQGQYTYGYAQQAPYPPYYDNGYSAQNAIPSQYKPLGPWAYFGLNLLFCIPVVGFVLLIVFSFSSKNLNRRNYARSFWCSLLFVVILSAVLVTVLAVTGNLDELRYLFY